MSRRERNLVLAVDDEADFLDLIAQIGHGVGCDVITADTATVFREQLLRRQPALILLDLQMPGMDGIEALRYRHVSKSPPASCSRAAWISVCSRARACSASRWA